MPKFDVKNQQFLVDFKIPEPPLTLHNYVRRRYCIYIIQELKKIAENGESYFIKEMMKEE